MQPSYFALYFRTNAMPLKLWINGKIADLYGFGIFADVSPADVSAVHHNIVVGAVVPLRSFKRQARP